MVKPLLSTKLIKQQDRPAYILFCTILLATV